MTDCVALVEFREALDRRSRPNWSADQGIDEWDGVSVGGTPRRVEALALPNLSMKAKLPVALGKLTALRTLDLSDNLFWAEIPAALGGLSQLEHLNLGLNRLMGPIPPELGQLTKLRTLDLAHNSLSGDIPQALADLPNLHEIAPDGHSVHRLRPARAAAPRSRRPGPSDLRAGRVMGRRQRSKGPALRRRAGRAQGHRAAAWRAGGAECGLHGCKSYACEPLVTPRGGIGRLGSGSGRRSGWIGLVVGGRRHCAGHHIAGGRRNASRCNRVVRRSGSRHSIRRAGRGLEAAQGQGEATTSGATSTVEELLEDGLYGCECVASALGDPGDAGVELGAVQLARDRADGATTPGRDSVLAAAGRDRDDSKRGGPGNPVFGGAGRAGPAASRDG